MNKLVFRYDKNIEKNIMNVVTAIAKDYEIHKTSKYSTDCEIYIEKSGDFSKLEDREITLEVKRTDEKNTKSHSIYASYEYNREGTEYVVLEVYVAGYSKQNELKSVTTTNYKKLVSYEIDKQINAFVAKTNHKKAKERQERYNENCKLSNATRYPSQEYTEYLEDVHDVLIQNLDDFYYYRDLQNEIISEKEAL